MKYQWNIFWVNLDPVLGSEQSGKRPVIIVSSDEANEALPIVTVLPITSVKPVRIIYQTEVLLKKNESGLSLDSIVMAHQIITIAKVRLEERCGEVISPDIINAIKNIIRLYLDL